MSCMVSPYSRVMDALELREPDRVPVFDLMMEHATVYTILGRKPTPISFLIGNRYSAKVVDLTFSLINKSDVLSTRVLEKINQVEMANFAYDSAKAAVTMGYDAAWLSYYPIFILRDSRTMHDVFGRQYEVKMGKKGYMVLPMYRKGLITSPDHWKDLDKKRIYRLLIKAEEVFSNMQKNYGDRLFIFGLVSTGLYETIWQSMGFERFVVVMRKNRTLLQEMIRFYTDFYCESLDVLAAAGIPGAVYTDDLAHRSGPMLNPKLLDELFGEAYRRITEKAHSLGVKIMIHSCGNVTSLLEWIADCGFDAVQPLEPTAEVELSRAKELVGNRICLIGNMDVTHILVSAEKEEVFAAVQKAIMDAGQGGGFVLAPAHNHEDVSVERLRWMVEAARQYGIYPLNGLTAN